MATLAERNRAKRVAATKEKAARRDANVAAMKAAQKRISDAASAKQAAKVAAASKAKRDAAVKKDTKKKKSKKKTIVKKKKKSGTKKKEVGLPAYSGEGSILGTQELYDETIKYRDKVENMSYADAAAIRAAAELARGKAKTPALKELQSARMRAAGDRMRLLTGRQKGQGTAYTGPGMRVALDAKGNIQRDDQGRVVYDVDPAAYSGRFIPKFTPTAEQRTMWQEQFPESDYGITEGLLTPWQQVNIQWMTGSKSDKLGLLDDMGVKATDKNLGLFTDDLKEGRIPAAFREAWREEKWGDVKDPQTGLWKPAQGEERQQAIAKQLERYEGGYFNPTTGKGGAAAGAPSQWGPGTGLIHPEDFVPEGWTGPLPAPGMGITGTPTGIFAPGGGGVGGVINQGAYRQPAPLDWSAIMPTDTPLASQQALVSGQGKFYQPWATGQGVPPGLLNYQVPGGAPANVGDSNPNLGLFDFNNQQNNQQLNNQTNQQVDWSGVPVRGGGDPYSSFEDFNEREYQRMYPGSREMANAAGFSGLSATRLNPAYRDYQQGNVNQMISAGILPAGSTNYGSGDWIRYQGLPDQTEAQNVQTPVVNVAGRNVG